MKTTLITLALFLSIHLVQAQQYLGNPFNPQCTANLDVLFEGKITIFPNPIDEVFFIDFDESEKLLQILLLDIIGKRVEGFDKNNVATGFDVSNFPSGMYMVELVFENGIFRSALMK